MKVPTMNDCPICSSPIVWIDNGPRLQYHYCRDCKLELKDLKRIAGTETLELTNSGGLDYPTTPTSEQDWLSYIDQIADGAD